MLYIVGHKDGKLCVPMLACFSKKIIKRTNVWSILAVLECVCPFSHAIASNCNWMPHTIDREKSSHSHGPHHTVKVMEEWVRFSEPSLITSSSHGEKDPFFLWTQEKQKIECLLSYRGLSKFIMRKKGEADFFLIDLSWYEKYFSSRSIQVNNFCFWQVNITYYLREKLLFCLTKRLFLIGLIAIVYVFILIRI